MNNQPATWTVRYAKDFIAIAISIASLIVAIKSCTISQHAQELTNSPFIAIKPVKAGSSDSYIELVPNFKNNSYQTTMRFEITNLGKTPAINVECLEKPRFNLQPGESHTLVSSIVFQKKNYTDLAADLEWFKSGNGFITSKFTIGYSSMFNPATESKVNVSYNIFLNNIILLNSN